MAKVTVTRELQDRGGRYAATVEGIPGEAELTISRVSPSLVIADSTLTPVAMRGQGVATALVERHPEWSDLRALEGTLPFKGKRPL